MPTIVFFLSYRNYYLLKLGLFGDHLLILKTQYSCKTFQYLYLNSEMVYAHGIQVIRVGTHYQVTLEEVSVKD
jgi:hypothetical protein